MPETQPGTTGAQRAITDLFDDARHTFLIQYPVSLIVTLGVSGTLVFAITGFLGYTNDPTFSRVVFHQAWLLFLWSCALIITLQVSIFRHPLLRRQLIATLTTTIISIVLVGILYFYRGALQTLLENLIQTLLHERILLGNLVTNPLTYAIINFGIIIAYWADSLRRWRRRARGLPPVASIDLTTGETETQAPDDLPSMQELIAGDLVAGTVLLIALALFFRSDVIGFIWHTLQSTAHITGCNVSWPLGNCTPPGNGLNNPPTLTFIDLVLALIALPLGLLVLALAAVLSAFGAISGVNSPELQQPAPAILEESSTEAVSEQVTQTLLDTLRSALNRRGRRGPSTRTVSGVNPLLSLRNILWPILIFFGVDCAAIFARDVRFYLQSSKGLAEVAIYVLPALTLGALSILLILCSAALLVFHGRVLTNSLRFLGPVGFTIILTLWIFSLALWGVNQFLLLTHASERHPFDPPGWVTAISLATLLVFAITLGVQRIRNRHTPPPPKARAMQGATLPSTSSPMDLHEEPPR